MKFAKKTFLVILSLLMIVTSVPFIAVSAAADPECEIGGKTYATLADAIKEANRSREDITIRLLTDVEWTIEKQDINSARGDITVTIDGKGHTITTSGNEHTFRVYENLIVKNTKFIHNAAGSLFEIYGYRKADGTTSVELDNVVIDASAPVARKYTVINTMGDTAIAGEIFNLSLTNTDILVNLDVSKSLTPAFSAIRTGNGGDTVNITATDCNIDVAGEGTSAGIDVQGNTNATINLTNTNIKSGIGYTVKANSSTKLTITGGVFETSRKRYDNTETEGSVTGFYSDNDAGVISGTTPTWTKKAPSIYIMGYQDTTASANPFDVRFIAAVADSLNAKNGFSMKMEISVANVTAGNASKEYNIATLSGTVAVNGNQAAVSKTGYKFGFVSYSGISKTGVSTFKVNLSYTLNGIEHSVGSATATYNNGTCEKYDYTLNVNELTGRYLLVSDIHFVTSDGRSSDDGTRYTYRGKNADTRLQLLIDSILAEKKKRGLDAVIVLGDVTTDDWYSGCSVGNGSSVHLALKDSMYPIVYVYKKLTEALGSSVPVYFLPGNHDSYYQSKWAAIFSDYGADAQSRQKTYVDGENVFILLDTYRGEGNDAMTADPITGVKNMADGNNWMGVDIPYLREQLEKYKDKENIFILSHEFAVESAAVKDLLKQYDNVVSMFEGHTHHYMGSATYGNLVPLINTGNFAYGDYVPGAVGNICKSCGGYECLWGFQMVETTADSVASYRVNVEHTYDFLDAADYYQPYQKYADIILK